jgi:RecB family endonuclease NucS
MKIAKLDKVDLRELWRHEALDFTKWLAEPDNLELLSDEIGIGIELVQTEANVGRYNVDILAQEENTGKKIIIENQLESTDHAHLGQLITYAAGLEAEYIIWLVREARDEHQQAVDW